MDRLRWGVLGVAGIAVDHVIPAMKKSANATVTAIASRDLERAQRAASEFEIPNAYGAYAELLASDAVDAVYIPLPNDLHLQWTLAAAAAGKHVLCEKPLALTSTDAQEMIDSCQSAGVHFMEAFMYRLTPTWSAVVRLVGEGSIGDLMAIHTRFSFFNDDPADIRNQVATGGGAMYDIGCYAINLGRLLYGAEPGSIKAVVGRDSRFGTDVLTSAILDFGGRHATFTVSTQLEADQHVHLAGTKGRIEIDVPFNPPPDRPTTIRLIRGGNPPADPNTETLTFAPSDPYTIETEAFSAAVLSDEPVPIDPADGVANLKVIERIFADSQ